MYVLIILIAGAIGVTWILRGIRSRRAGPVRMGALALAATALLFGLMSFWGDMLWFEHAGYAGRFWTAVLAMAGMTLIGGAAAGLSVLLLALVIPKRLRLYGYLGSIVGAVGGGLWGLASWEIALQFVNRVGTGVVEPIFGHDVAFYLFTLPFLERVHSLLFGAAALFALAVAATRLQGTEGGADMLVDAPAPAEPARRPESGAALARPLFLSVGLFALVLALGRGLDAYQLLYSRWGVVYGPGWTDVHVRLPACYVVAALLALVGASLVVAGAVPRLSERLYRRDPRLVGSVLAPASALGVAWLVGLVLLPGLFQWLHVAPNEITVERPYLARNIEFTRRGFDLQKVEEKAFAPSGRLTPEVTQANQHLLSEVRLWDPQALKAVLEQFQQIRLYYEIADIDIDRYTMGDRYRQVMVAAREMEQANLSSESQTFVNRHIKYTHGYGLAVASAHDFTEDGLPNLLVKDIPPASTHPELRVDRPEIYYGQTTRDYVVANTKELEFDYPSGESNAYSRYSGVGGVPLSSFWRKLVFGWTLGGTRLLFSTYPTDESRVLFHRRITERVAKLAPFLDLDHDPYITIVGGRLQWIVDAYTTSRHYPYSDPYLGSDEVVESPPGQGGRTFRTMRAVAGYLRGANYIRNAVKAVVDAYDGTVTFYVFEPRDPIVQVWSRIYPGLFKAREEMPAELRAHVRYPEGFLLAQGLVYAKYHMTDPEVFYNQEDLWIRATERYYDDVRPVDPYYVMWRPPGSPKAEFTLIQPFTPKNRQVLIGWVAGLSDGDNYGRLIAYRFPKDEWVLGTQQVDTKIDQDRFLSAQLSLWDQGGSRVIRGNVLVIPIDDTMLYVEPIYLMADAAAYPELRVVVVMHGDRMSYADTFQEALRGLVLGEPAGRPVAGLEALTVGSAESARRASEALGSYLRLLGERRFEEAAGELRALERALAEMQGAPERALPGLPAPRPGAAQ